MHRDLWVRMLFPLARKKKSGSSFFVTITGYNLQEASVIERYFHVSILELKKQVVLFHPFMIQNTSIKMKCAGLFLTRVVTSSDLCSLTQRSLTQFHFF